MKTIFPKFKFNNMTYILILSFLLTGFIKNIWLILLIVIVHELGHVFFLKCFHYEIISVEIFPFGGLTTTEKKLNSPINKDILIYLGGIIFQIFLFFCFFILYKEHWILENTFHLFKIYNKTILFFNLLPIRPLDGGEIFLLLLQKVFPFKKAMQLMNNLSIFFLLLFLIFNIKSNLNEYMAIAFLVCKLFQFFKKSNWYQNKFLLERYMYTIPYKKIEHNLVQNTDCLKKETLHFFKEKEKYLHEKEIIKRKFDRKTYF